MNTSRLHLLFCIDWHYLLFHRSIILKKKGSKLVVSKGVKISQTKIIVQEGATCILERNVILRKSSLNITRNSFVNLGEKTTVTSKNIIVNGSLVVGSENFILGNGDLIWIQNGRLEIGTRNRVKGGIWIRFGGKVKIDNYNTINEGTEIRCDELVTIGSYNQVSMNIRIWDTNTHRMFYNEEELETFIISHYPNWDEDQKPKTKPVIIGNNNWIGEYAFIKNTIIGNHCIIGTRTMVIGKNLKDNLIVTNKIECRYEEY